MGYLDTLALRALGRLEPIVPRIDPLGFALPAPEPEPAPTPAEAPTVSAPRPRAPSPRIAPVVSAASSRQRDPAAPPTPAVRPVPPLGYAAPISAPPSRPEPAPAVEHSKPARVEVRSTVHERVIATEHTRTEVVHERPIHERAAPRVERTPERVVAGPSPRPTPAPRALSPRLTPPPRPRSSDRPAPVPPALAPRLERIFEPSPAPEAPPAPSPREVRVSIGRIVVHAEPPRAAPPRPRVRPPEVGLGDYLAARDRGRR